MKASKLLSPLGRNVVIYLAAAVSDFYLPEDRQSDHKIQSDDGALRLTLEPVPKLIKPLVKKWCNEAFVVSFKLETDERLLLEKGAKALMRYKHQLVVANQLQTRKEKVCLLMPDGIVRWIHKEEATGIEELLVHEIINLHNQHQENKVYY